MAFRNNRSLEGTEIGSRLKLTKSLKVLKGEFLEGSVLRVTGEPDFRGEFECIDEESGETVYLHPSLSNFVPYNQY